MLVHQEGDLQAAEAYCCRAAQGQDSQFRQTLLLTLLQIYLSSEVLTSAAVDLLNNNPRVFVAEKIIQLLPDSWSIQLVSQFLVRSLRESFHQRQMARLQKALGQVECRRHKVIWVSLMTYQYFIFFSLHEHCVYSCFLLILKPVVLSLSHQQMQASNTKFRLDKGQKCKVCQRDLAEPQFACNLHGELMHTSCIGFSSS